MVELVIDPEPDPETRDALTLALERLLYRGEQPSVYASAWRQAGIAENLDDVDPSSGLGDRAPA